MTPIQPLPSEGKNRLYVGTTGLLAKLAPVKGFDAPVTLTDVYPAAFAAQTFDAEWGIAEVNIEVLFPDSFAPFRRKKLPKGSWRDSLANCGVCLYNLPVPATAITRVTIYKPSSNLFVTKASLAAVPWETSVSQHQASYALYFGLTRWLMCEAVKGPDLGLKDRNLSELNEELLNRSGLDIFYRRTEKEGHAWWRAIEGEADV